jgi:hypothetical protein
MKLPEWNLESAEQLLLQCAAIVDKIGPTAQPLLDRAEAEYMKLKTASSATDRIKKMLGK